MPTQTFFNLPDEKKKRILLAAKKEFSRVSLEEASINNIIIDCKIARGSFYQYFENKQDLFEFLIRSVNDNLKKIVKEKLKERGDIFETFIYFYDRIIEISKSKEDNKFYKTVLINLRANDGILFGLNNSESEINKYVLENTDTSKFLNKDDLPIVIDMLNAITRWAIIKSVILKNKSDLRQNYLRQIEYLKYGILRKEKKC